MKEDLAFAIEVARGAAAIVAQHYGKAERLTKTHAAATQEAVTEVDRASQRFIVEKIRAKFPGDGIIGEESDTGESITADIANAQGRNWVIDPIDGTNNFVAGFPGFAICIGLLDKGMPVLGIVLDVMRGWVYAAAKGEGATLNGKKVTAPTTPLSESSILMMTSNLLIKGKLPGWVVHWMGQTDWKVRVIGSAALEAAQVAAGIAHGAITVNGKLWDLVAPAAIVMESGGVVTDLAGKPIFPFDVTGYSGAKVPFVVAGKNSIEEILKEMREHP